MINRFIDRLKKKLVDAENSKTHTIDLELPHEERIRKWGHRAYIGGHTPEMWYGIGRRQYHFLTSRGLKHNHVFLDVACGSLRLGQYVIPMLDKGNYYGLEAEASLIEKGLENELLFDNAEIKQPSFASNYDFDLSFCPGYDFAIAQSLFTHLTTSDIAKCLDAMIKVAKPKSQFYFTFFEGDGSPTEHSTSHANRDWKYQFSKLEEMAKTAGFQCQYIGDWQHERKQMMAVATPQN